MNVSSKLSHNSYRKLSRFIHAKDIIGFLYLINGIFYYSTLDFDTWHKALVLLCFKRIDDNLKNLRELVNGEPHLIWRQSLYHEHKNPYLLMKLKALKKQHLTISDAVQMLNMIFNLQLLATIIMTFAELTFQLQYFYIMHWKIGMLMSVDLIDPIYDLFLMMSITYYSIKIMLMIWACETGKDQAMKISITVHDLLNSTSDDQIRNELQLFSLQVLHRENAFSAKGLIVDATLLTAVSEQLLGS
ncbi:uncharacterized protein [Temnothorax longispinosus]|uniref:uncharacterized protein n=1 Tax=Temnothorax longispinosus TaxID=300112 RepID=UPI003A9A3E33